MQYQYVIIIPTLQFSNLLTIGQFRNEQKTGPSLFSQRLLGLLLGTRKKRRPMADQRVSSNHPEVFVKANLAKFPFRL